MSGRLGKYEIVKELGRGATGVVFLAHDPAANRQVAIKVLQIAHSVAPADRPKLLERFEREARAASRIVHPAVPIMYDIGEAEGRHFIVMEYCAGRTLHEVLAMEGPRPVAEALRIAEQLLDALRCAHAAGVLHRDVKPDNVMLMPDGSVKLMDFGVARTQMDPALTRVGELFGTPAYMAPEQIAGGAADNRADLFSMGVLLTEMISGRRPFEGSSITDMLVAVTTHEPSIPASIPPRIADCVRIALEKLPQHRFQSARDMADALAGRIAVRPVRQLPQAPPGAQPPIVAARPSAPAPPASPGHAPAVPPQPPAAVVRFCNQCGSPVPPAARFCQCCGAPVAQPPAQPPTAQWNRPPASPAPGDPQPIAPPPAWTPSVQPPAQWAQPPQLPASTTSNPLIVVAAIIGLVLIALAIWAAQGPG